MVKIKGLLNAKRCSNVLLHLKYKVLLCDPNIKFIILAGGKALATDHRVRLGTSVGRPVSPIRHSGLEGRRENSRHVSCCFVNFYCGSSYIM